jgi:hypothetical protein
LSGTLLFLNLSVNQATVPVWAILGIEAGYLLTIQLTFLEAYSGIHHIQYGGYGPEWNEWVALKRIKNIRLGSYLK